MYVCMYVVCPHLCGKITMLKAAVVSDSILNKQVLL